MGFHKFIKNYIRNRQILTVVLLSAVIFIYTGCGKSSSANSNVNTNTSQSKTVETKIVTADAQDVSKYIEATGTFQADETTDVAAETSGKVAQTLVNEGDFVNAGDVLVRLDQEDANLRLQQAKSAENQAGAQLAQAEAQQKQAEAQLRQSQASLGLDKGGNFSTDNIPAVRQARATLVSRQSDLKLAQSTQKRYENLLETGDTSRLIVDQKRNETEKAQAAVNEAQEALRAAENTARQSNQAIESARANVQSAEASVKNAQASVQNAQTSTAIAAKTVTDTAVRAPFAGFVSARSVAAGEYISPTTPIATIVRSNPIKVRLQIPEKESSSIRVGMNVSASVAAFADRNFAGQVISLNPIVNETARSLQVEAQFENPNNLLRPGMFATARILQPGGDKGIFVPQSAVVTEKNTNSLGVYVIENGTARLRTVQIDESTREAEQIRILSGVNEGEQVATTNTEQLFDGAKVAF